MKKAGKKTREWEAARKKLKIAFAKASITRCESCNSDFALSFAHSKPRRIIVGDEIFECALLCSNCHQACDAHGHAKMEEFVKFCIRTRPVPVVL